MQTASSSSTSRAGWASSSAGEGGADAATASGKHRGTPHVARECGTLATAETPQLRARTTTPRTRPPAVSPRCKTGYGISTTTTPPRSHRLIDSTTTVNDDRGGLADHYDPFSQPGARHSAMRPARQHTRPAPSDAPFLLLRRLSQELHPPPVRQQQRPPRGARGCAEDSRNSPTNNYDGRLWRLLLGALPPARAR